MADLFSIVPAATARDIQDAARLFEHYASTLPVDLDYQDFNSELSGLPGKYARPAGAILLARNQGGEAVGCVGVRPLSFPVACEMKRLFTLPSTRGGGLGRCLTEAAIAYARKLGYAEMKLDTLSTMTAAIGLYRHLGFVPCDPYYAPTPPETLFMTLRL